MTARRLAWSVWGVCLLATLLNPVCDAPGRSSRGVVTVALQPEHVVLWLRDAR